MFRQANNATYVNTFALEVYLPSEYMGKAYRGYEYYSLVGSNVRFFAVGMMRTFNNEKELNNPNSVKCYPLGVPMRIESSPSSIDVREIQFTKNGPIRKVIVLTYYKGDAFIIDNNSIQSSNNMMILLSLLEGGKLSFFPPDAMVQLLADCEKFNKINLRVPSEEEEIFIAERYRNPANHYKKARLSSNVDSDTLTAYNIRQDTMQTSTYQAWIGEDISSSLIVSANRHADGVVDNPTIMERIVRNMDMNDIIEDRDKRYAETAETIKKATNNEQEQ